MGRLRRAARLGAVPRSPTATISSRPRTEMPSATTRAGEPVLDLGVLDAEQGPGVPGREHARRRPVAARPGESFSSRSVLLICGRLRPIRVASSSCVQPKSSSSCW